MKIKSNRTAQGRPYIWTLLALALILALSLLTACGGGGNTAPPPTAESSSSSAATTPAADSSSSSAATPPASDSGSSSSSGNDAADAVNQNADVILPSQLITIEDAERILGLELVVDEKNNDYFEPLSFGDIHTQYKNAGGGMGFFTIRVRQDAALDLTNSTQKRFLEVEGTKGYAETIRVEREKEIAEGKARKIDGLGDWAYLHYMMSGTVSCMTITDGDYYIFMQHTVKEPADLSDEEKLEWRDDRILELAKLAVERLDAIVK